MKAFITALCVLIIICISITISAVHISKACTELEDLVRTLPSIPSTDNLSEFREVLEQFHSVWSKHRRIMHFTVGHSVTDSIDDHLTELIIRYTHHDEPGYAAAKRSLLVSIQRLHDAERFSIDGIF